MKSFRAETPDRSKRQASGQVTQDSIAVGFGSVVVQKQEARFREPGITVPHPRSYPPLRLDRGESRYGGDSMLGRDLSKDFQSMQTRCASLSAVESAGLGSSPLTA